MPQERLDAIDELAETFDVDRSVLLRQFDAFGLEQNSQAVGVEARISARLAEIKEQAWPIDRGGGFAGRVEDNFEERFESGYDPEWLVAKAESYYREAEMLEEELQDHPDAPEIEEGDLQAEVDRVLEETLRSTSLSEYGDRYEEKMKRHEGVKEGLEGRKLALSLTVGAMSMDRDGRKISGVYGGERRVDGDDLSAYAVDELPEDVGRDDVARVARELVDAGLHPEEIETDPEEFDPFEVDEHAAEPLGVDVPDEPDPELDGDGTVAVGDGGDHAAIQSFDEPDDVVEDEEERDPEEIVDGRDVGDLVEWTAESLGRDNARRMVTANRLHENPPDWVEIIMDRSTLTTNEILDRAAELNDEREQASVEDAGSGPRAVADANGGVRIE